MTDPRIEENTFRHEQPAIDTRAELRRLGVATTAIDYDEGRDLFTFRIWQPSPISDDASPAERLATLEADYNALASHPDFEPSEKYPQLLDLERKVHAARTLGDYPMPDVLSAVEASPGGVFRNAFGDYLVEPVGDDEGELILVRADGTTATLRGQWQTGFEA